MSSLQSEQNAEKERLDKGSVEERDRRLFFRVIGLLLPLAVLLAAGVIATWLMKTSPQAKPRPQEPTAALVEVMPVSYSSQQVVIHAMGEVVPAMQIALKPQVSGEIISISENLLPGGLIRSGHTILKIDPKDYELAVRQLTSEVVQAESELEVEKGSQLIARNEYDLLSQDVNEEDLDLVLRRPQLKSVHAALASTRAKLEKAELDLERTTIIAPFNAIVKSRDVNIGTRVTDSTLLANLAGTDAYWVVVSVATNQLQWIRIPRNDSEKGSLVRVYDQALWGDNVYRIGRVIRLAAELEEQGRMARMIVSVEDPLSLEPGNAEKPRIILGSYVRCEIEGIQLASVADLGRGHIRDGNNVWIMDSENKLDIRPVEITFRGRDRVMISGGIKEGERLVVSRLATPVQGMPLRISSDDRGGAHQSLESDDAVGEVKF